MKIRLHAFFVRTTADASMVLIQTAVPLLALRFGAGAVLLGAMGWVPMALRLPFSLSSGPLSEKVGRKTIAVPAVCVMALAAAAIGFSRSNVLVLLFFVLFTAADGAFRPAIQSFIGDISERGQLTSNLAAFNLGWGGGIAVTVFVLAWLVSIALDLPVYIGAGSCALTALLVILWRKKAGKEPVAQSNETSSPGCDPRVLLASRLTLLAGYVGFGAIRILFPKLGQHLGWTDREIAATTAYFLGGVGLGLLATNLRPWWRGRFWPQLVSQGLMLISGIVAAFTPSPIVLDMAFFAVGAVLALANTSALYHGLSWLNQRGKNTGIHEGLISGGVVVGCLIGGVLAQRFSPRAPFVLFGAFTALCLLVSAGVTLSSVMSRK